MTSWVTRFFLKSGKSGTTITKTKHKNYTAKPVDRSFQAVTIYSKNLNCCEAAERIKGRKFLAAHAPQLPLGGCSQTDKCHCRYRHLDDRRQDLRRDADFGLPARSPSDGERRYRSDRRHQGDFAQ